MGQGTACAFNASWGTVRANCTLWSRQALCQQPDRKVVGKMVYQLPFASVFTFRTTEF